MARRSVLVGVGREKGATAKLPQFLGHISGYTIGLRGMGRGSPVTTQASPIVFFDIGNTLGSVRFSADQPHRIERLDVYPQVPSVLQELRDRGIQLGVISDVGQESEQNVRRLLEEGNVYELFEEGLLVYGEKDSPDIFRLAAERAGHSDTPSRCLYVGENRQERGYALEAGLRVAPHPRLALDVLNGSRLRYVRVTVPANTQGKDAWQEVLLSLAVVPIHVTEEDGTTVYAIATTDAASQLDDLGFEVARLGNDDLPLATEVYLLRDDRQVRTGFLVEEGESRRLFGGDEESRLVLASRQGGLYVALPPDRSVLQYHFAEAHHGHNLKLVPAKVLLESTEGDRAEIVSTSPGAEGPLSQEEVDILRNEVTPESVAAYVDRYSGKAPVSNAEGVKIRSRHAHHEDNALAVAALLSELKKIGGDDFSVGLHRFTELTLKGRYELDNVEAEILGSEPHVPPREVVLITAHLDSTAASSTFDGRAYDPDTDPAPGADDDGSGVAGVLAAANAIKKLSAIKRPKRTIRFVLFNAEEVGLVGSGEYARDQRALLGRGGIGAVYQMDMIGYNKEAPLTYEVHAGSDRLSVQNQAFILAERIQQVAKQVSPNLPDPQIYVNTGLGEESKDQVYNRSDHYSFNVVGYPACLASEDFLPGAPVSEVNPNYHMISDTFVDSSYAADIARAVAAAAWITANLKGSLWA